MTGEAAVAGVLAADLTPYAAVTGTAITIPGVRHASELLSGRPLHPLSDVPQQLPSGRELRFKDRATLLALAAAEAALADAGLLAAGGVLVGSGDGTGVVASSNLGNLDTVCRAAEAVAGTGPAELRVMDLPNATSSVIATSVAIRFGLHGVNLTLCNGATSGLDAVGWAARVIAAGRAERMVVLGVEPANPVLWRLFAGALLDGAAAVVLESRAAATQRGRHPRAAIAGYARRRDPATAARRLGATEIGLWVSSADGTAPAPPHATRCDLSRALPAAGTAASGALGVLQCVAATAWLGAGHPPTTPLTALATAGGGHRDDAASAVLLTAVPGPGAPDPAPPEATAAPEGER